MELSKQAGKPAKKSTQEGGLGRSHRIMSALATLGLTLLILSSLSQIGETIAAYAELATVASDAHPNTRTLT